MTNSHAKYKQEVRDAGVELNIEVIIPDAQGGYIDTLQVKLTSDTLNKLKDALKYLD